jgi:hypothetical protein
VPASFELRVRFQVDKKVEIPRNRTVRTGTSFAGDSYARALINSRWDVDA